MTSDWKDQMRSQTYKAHLTHRPSVVSDFLARLEHDPLWRREIIKSELVSGSSGETGAVYRERVDWEGIRASVPLAVVEHAPGRRLLLRSEEPGFQGSSEYTFTEENGGTLLVLVQSVTMSGALKLVEPFMWGVITRWLDRDVDCIDEAIASLGTQPQPGRDDRFHS